MNRIKTLVIAAAIVSLCAGCTARYSQSLVGSIPKSSGSAVSSTATGLSIFSIAVEEPTPAHEQVRKLMESCGELTGVEVDYRELVIIIVGIPRVTVSGTCVK